MRCDDARHALSARLDGETIGLPPALLDAHLESCPLCEAWLAGAERVNQAVRAPSVAVPDLTARILAAVHADGSLPAPRAARAHPVRRRPAWLTWPWSPATSLGVASWSPATSPDVASGSPATSLGVASWSPERITLALRWALGVLAVAQVMVAVPDLFGVAGFLVGHEAHAGREVAAFDVAIGVGLLLVASYPQYARVFAPVVVTLVVCFASVSVLDVIQGAVAPGRVAIHGVAVVQAALVWWLARSGRSEDVGSRGVNQDGVKSAV